MNYAWVRDMALKLIDQYSVAGELVAPSYNNQTDYLLKIPALVNDGLTVLFTEYCPVRDCVPIRLLNRIDLYGMDTRVLPDDAWKVCGSCLIAIGEDGFPYRFSGYRLVGDNLIALERGAPEDLLLEYYTRQELLSDRPDDGEEVSGTQEMHAVLPYYVAAHLVMHDNSFAYQALYNEFVARAQRLAPDPRAELDYVEDAYSFREGGA